MRLVIQRVSRAEVRVGQKTVGKIGHGLLVLLAAEKGDDAPVAEEAARKVSGLRVFPDDTGKMNRSLSEVGGSVLMVSQFTLTADLSRGRRPGFERALPGELARPLCEHFVHTLELLGVPVAMGSFGEMMQVELINDGPATFVLDVEGRGSRAKS
ncbi:MAG TPA: D-aminoacyl-tRNA deacylase [Thermoanaerobaculia bacterium]|nr:D-aminoacyl-tRNA deacylase [Thermoanaerobaculia bacterium]